MHITEFQGYVNQAFGFARPTRYRFQIDVASLLQTSFGGKNILKDIGFKNPRFAQRLQFFCHQVQFPGKAFMVSNARTYGPNYQIPESSAYFPFSAVFYVGHDMQEKRFFDAWLSCIENPISWDYNFYDEYTTTAIIYQDGDISPLPALPGAAGKIQQILNQGLDYASDIAPYIPGAMNVVSKVANFPQNVFSYLNKGKRSNTVTQTLNSIFGTQYYCRIWNIYPISIEPLNLGYNMLDQIHALQVTFNYHHWDSPGSRERGESSVKYETGPDSLDYFLPKKTTIDPEEQQLLNELTVLE